MNEITLTEVQEQIMLDLWNKTPSNPPSLMALTHAIFGHECDGRSCEGRAVKKALAKHNLRAKASSDYEKKEEIVLTEEQKVYALNNAKTMSSLDMARILFKNHSLTPLHAETRAVYEYIKTLKPVAMFEQIREDIPTKSYEPPKDIPEAVERVNTYLHASLDINKLTPSQKKNLEMLIHYLHTYRFIAQMNTYLSIPDRKLCEDAFIRATYDKPDLAQEEIDQYIEYSNQVVAGFTIQRRSNQLQNQLEEITTSNDDSLKISMSLVEAIGKASTEFHQCAIRQQKLLEDLKEKRSARISKQVRENASILNLIQLWKAEETRQELLAHAEKEQQAIANEVNRLSSLPDIKARILGLTKEEILHG